MFNFTTLRSLSVLSRTQIKHGNTSALRYYATKTIAKTHTGSLGFITNPIIFRSIPHLSSLQLTKIIGSNLIQKRLVSANGDHTKLWKLERIISATFIPLIPLCFIYENQILDSIWAVLTVMHYYWGVETVLIDYARPAVVGNIFPKICFVLLYLSSAFILGGLLVLVYNGPGISKVIKNGWAIGKNE